MFSLKVVRVLAPRSLEKGAVRGSPLLIRMSKLQSPQRALVSEDVTERGGSVQVLVTAGA